MAGVFSSPSKADKYFPRHVMVDCAPVSCKDSSPQLAYENMGRGGHEAADACTSPFKDGIWITLKSAALNHTSAPVKPTRITRPLAVVGGFLPMVVVAPLSAHGKQPVSPGLAYHFQVQPGTDDG